MRPEPRHRSHSQLGNGNPRFHFLGYDGEIDIWFYLANDGMHKVYAFRSYDNYVSLFVRQGLGQAPDNYLKMIPPHLLETRDAA